jgi:hypothetical protein
MKILFDARVEDLGPRDVVKVECVCGHTESLTAAMLRTASVLVNPESREYKSPHAIFACSRHSPG